jgi:predicted nicotinamide N-methyase
MKVSHESNRVTLPDFLPETPRDAVGPVVTESVLIDGRTFQMLRPAEPDRLLDNPAVIKAFEHDEYMPYWADLWPAARMLAKAILRETWPRGLEALELGCGLGLPGVVGLAVGLNVTFSDYDATALHFAAENARLNGFTNFKLLRLDWRHPPNIQFPLILAADLLYEARNVEPVVGLLKKMLASDGLCLLTDQDRNPAPLLRQCVADNGFDYTMEMMRAGQPTHADMPRLRVKGTLYRIRHRRESP